MANAAAPKKPAPRLLTVKEAIHITPNMVRVTFAGPELEGFPTGREGGNCKIMLPAPGQSKDEFAEQLANGPKPVTRTYTVRYFREDRLELDIDFVAHGDEGPASAWASAAKPGDFCGFAGASLPKMMEFTADWYLVAADMSALPVASAALEAMPDDARGIAIFEIMSEADRQTIRMPDGIEAHWLVQEDPHKPSGAQENLIRSMDWPEGRVQTCIAGESGVIKALRGFLHQEKKIPRTDTYISGYWKIGLVEDQHQAMKRAEAG